MAYFKMDYRVKELCKYRGIRYHIFALWWLWKHRNWKPTRQKYKAMEKEWLKKVGR